MELFKTNKLNIDELKELNSLLKVDTNFNDCLTIISNSNNQQIIENLRNELLNGTNISIAILKYLPNGINDYLKVFSDYMAFKNALDLSLAFYLQSIDSQSNIMKSLAYPLALLFLSLTGLYIFDAFGLDKILALLTSLKSSYSDLLFKRYVVRLIINFSYFTCLFTSLLLTYLTTYKRIRLLFIVFNKVSKDNLMSLYYTNEYIGLYSLCIQSGYKSKETIEILHSLKHRPIVSFLSYILKEKLEEGESLLNGFSSSYFDSKLLNYLKIGTYTNSFNEALNKYLANSKYLLNQKLKALTISIQLFTYGLIGIIVIFMYQVLFLPMQLINTY